MSRHPQESNSHGSLKNLQVAINEKKRYLDCEISKVIGKQMSVDWKSPQKTDKYAEYRDEDFLKKLGRLNEIKYPLIDFWPKRGPQWDALGASGDEIILVAYFGNIRTLFPVTSGQRFGIIRTAFRHIRTPCRIIK